MPVSLVQKMKRRFTRSAASVEMGSQQLFAASDTNDCCADEADTDRGLTKFAFDLEEKRLERRALSRAVQPLDRACIDERPQVGTAIHESEGIAPGGEDHNCRAVPTCEIHPGDDMVNVFAFDEWPVGQPCGERRRATLMLTTPPRHQGEILVDG